MQIFTVQVILPADQLPESGLSQGVKEAAHFNDAQDFFGEMIGIDRTTTFDAARLFPFFTISGGAIVAVQAGKIGTGEEVRL